MDSRVDESKFFFGVVGRLCISFYVVWVIYFKGVFVFVSCEIFGKVIWGLC